MKVKELIKKLNKHNLNKDVVVYSNEKTLKNYEFLGTYENEGQVEIHIDEGINLEGYNGNSCTTDLKNQHLEVKNLHFDKVGY